MIVENPEAFKTWLTAVLKPMCDADPAALAKYVIALIKKDRADDELKKSMIGQLEVFLQEETESFVNLVFQTLQSQEYITTPIIPNANPPNPNIVKKDPPKDTKPPVEPFQLAIDQVNGSVRKEPEKRDREPKRDSDKDDKSRSRPRHRSGSRNRSRSRSWGKNRSPARSPRDKRAPRRDAWRNKSPPAGARRYDRRRSRTPPTRSRSRSPGRPYDRRFRFKKSRSASRSRSRSPIREPADKRKDSKSDRERSRSPPPDGHFDSGGAHPTGPKRRCRDFDEKGYCMRGEMCPFDHGVDPVVLEDTTLSTVLGYNPNGTPEVPPAIPPIIPGPRHPITMGPGVIPPSEYNPQTPFLRGYSRGPRPIGARMPMMFPPPPSMNRELIPVPVMDNKYAPNFAPNQPPFGDGPDAFKKKPFDYNRLGPRQKNMANCSLELKKVPAGLNTITHLNNHFSKFGKIVNINLNYEGDPEAAIVTFSSHAEANAAYRSTEAVLNNRFIKVFWHNAHNEGKQENVPPRPVKERLGTAAPPVHSNKVLNLVQPRADEQTPLPPGTAEADAKQSEQQSKVEARAQVTAAIKKNQELLAAKEKLKKNQNEQRKEMLKMKLDLRKRKQELLEKQLSQQKILIEKMEKLPPGPQRDLVKETIKKTQESIEEIRKDIAQTAIQAPKTPIPPKKSKEDTQKEMLDIELDLIAKQQEGVDTTEIQKRYLELKAKTSMLKAKVARGRRYNPIARHLLTKNNLIGDGTVVKTTTKLIKNPSTAPAVTVNYQKNQVDHRPTRILVSGYEIDEQESVLTHFQQFGEIADYVTDSALPSVTLNYKNRKEAEMALIKGKNFQDRTLSITWCTNKQFTKQLSNSSTSKKVLISESEEELIDQSFLEGDDDLVEVQGVELSEEVLLQDDEEEEEENEDRSWRR